MVVEDFILLRIGKGVEVFSVNGILACHIVTERDSSLLPVKHIERPIGVLCPIDYVERIALADSVDNRIPLLVLVDEFPLIRRADIEFAVVADNPVLIVVVDVVLRNFTDGNIELSDMHNSLIFKFLIQR